jgi:enamine deaminase RidA (YjgF/YER057c/UK114 family)
MRPCPYSRRPAYFRKWIAAGLAGSGCTVGFGHEVWALPAEGGDGTVEMPASVDLWKGDRMTAQINIYNPAELGPPIGQYHHVTRVKASEFLFIAGMLAGNSKGEIVGDGDFDAQAAQVFANISAALRSADAGWSNVVQFTTYLVHSQDIPKFMAFRLREFPKMFINKAYPPNTLLTIDRLVDERFLVEVQTVAAL